MIVKILTAAGLKKHQAREANRVLYDVLSRGKHGVQESDAVQKEVSCCTVPLVEVNRLH